MFADAVYKGERLLEVVECIQEDEVDELCAGDVEFGEHVERGETC